jgi:UDP-GlcNAc:undecaprenyl-phosphate GlcNAc-1-phosphate transferase
MDGLDGLAGGCGVIVALFFGIATYFEGSHFVYIFCYVLFASALGFLIFNFPRARIFMGDVGSQFLGFSFAAIAVIAAEYDLSRTSALVMPLLFFNFIFDTGLTFFRRLAMRQNVTEAHRSHLYQLMNRLGASHFQVSMFHFAVTAAQGVGVLVLIQLPAESRALVFLPFVVFQIAYAAIILRRAGRQNLLGSH